MLFFPEKTTRKLNKNKSIYFCQTFHAYCKLVTNHYILYGKININLTKIILKERRK